ncbi:hypothetical protein EPR50_G00176230 [Perca flavescens]|uniref:Uncharacterized protein n=1 Tax=Perca flavescens TaxID=8167 RepID=A0A484CGW8_PERFV|nr:hypothetical protein EPR50_G00176230 [Perca flavescens]
MMAVSCLTRALRSLTLSQPALLCSQAVAQTKLGTQVTSTVGQCRGFLTTASLEQNRTFWKQREKYTTRPIGMKKDRRQRSLG